MKDIRIQTDFTEELKKKDVTDEMKKKALEMGEAIANSLEVGVDLTINSGKRVQ